MAQKVQTLLVDDLDGSEAVSTISFGLDGTDYEIDLNEAHAAELRASLAEYVGAGRKVGSAQRRNSRSGARRSVNGQPTPSEVRDWAKSQGIEVRDRGRVPAELIVKFKAAQGS
jgi:hypothetical protein